MATLVPGSVTVCQGVLTGCARFEDGRTFFLRVATADLSADQRKQPIPDLVVALAETIAAGGPCPATVVLGSATLPDADARAARIGQPVSDARRAAIDAVLKAVGEPLPTAV